MFSILYLRLTWNLIGIYKNLILNFVYISLFLPLYINPFDFASSLFDLLLPYLYRLYMLHCYF